MEAALRILVLVAALAMAVIAPNETVTAITASVLAAIVLDTASPQRGRNWSSRAKRRDKRS